MEGTSETVDAEAAPPSVQIPEAAKKDKKPAAPAPRAPLDPVQQHIQRAEGNELKLAFDNLGPQGSYSIRISRKEPEDVYIDGQRVVTAGHLGSVDHMIDEDWLQRKYGGGKYELRLHNAKGQYQTLKTVSVAGEPNLDALPKSSRKSVEPAAAPASGGSDPLVMKTVDIFAGMAKDAQAEARQARAAGGGTDPMMAVLIEQNRQLNERLDRMLAERMAPPRETAEDKVTSRVLDQLLTGENQRASSERSMHESEVRQLRDAMSVLEQRLRDQFDRDRAAMVAAHERELALVRTMYDNQLTTMKISHEVALSAASTSAGVTNTTLASENKRLLGQLEDLKDEVKELRSRKEKSPLDLAQEYEKLKDIFGGDDDADKSTIEKLIGAVNPDVIGAIMGGMRGTPAPAPPAPAPAPRAITPARRRMVRDKRDGQKKILEADGSLTPVPEHPPEQGAGPAEDGSPPPPRHSPMPVVDPEVVANAVRLLEGAMTSGKDPTDEQFLATARSYAPQEMILAIQDHGVDRVMAQMAKLPSTSPLASIQGKTWLRKFGKALVGE